MEQLKNNSILNPYSPPGETQQIAPAKSFDENLDRKREHWSKCCLLSALTMFSLPLLFQVAVGFGLLSFNPLVNALVLPGILVASMFLLLVGPFICFQIGKDR